MTYSIKITNKNIDYDVTPEVIDLSTISPTLITNPDIPYAEYASDVQNESTSVFIPLYKRSQYVELKAGSVLIIQTEDSDEAIYYRNMELDNVTILCDPDPMGGNVGPEPSGSFTSIHYPWSNNSDNHAINMMIARSNDGVYDFRADGPYFPDELMSTSPYGISCLDPVKKIIFGPPTSYTITPAEDFDGFYDSELNKKSYTGDTITPGDGKAYRVFLDLYSNAVTVKRFNSYNFNDHLWICE